MQPGFFDDEDRLAKLEKLGDPLPRLDSIVDWQPEFDMTRPKIGRNHPSFRAKTAA